MSFQQLLIILWVRKRLALTYLFSIVGLTLVLSLMMSKQYIAHASLMLDQEAVNPITGAEMRTQLVSTYMTTQTDIIKSPSVALAVVDALKLQNDDYLKASFQKGGATGDFKNWIAQGLMKKLDIVTPRESSILVINFSADNPKFAADVTNAFAQAYIQVFNDLKRRAAQQTADWFDVQLKILRERVEHAREGLSNYQQTQGIIASGNEKIDLEEAKLAELSSQLVKNQLQTDELITKKTLLSNTLTYDLHSLESLSEVLNDVLLKSLKQDLAKSESKLADLAVRVDKNHPQYLQAAAENANLRKQIKVQTNLLLRTFNNNLASFKQRDKSLMKALDQQKLKVLQLKKQYDEISVLAREAANAQQAYDAVMQRSIQKRMESEIRQSSIAILDKAFPPEKPDSPKITLNIVLSLFLGIVAGVGAALFAEIMDKRVRIAADISDAIGLPVFGVLDESPATQKVV